MSLNFAFLGLMAVISYRCRSFVQHARTGAFTKRSIELSGKATVPDYETLGQTKSLDFTSVAMKVQREALRASLVGSL